MLLLPRNKFQTALFKSGLPLDGNRKHPLMLKQPKVLLGMTDGARTEIMIVAVIIIINSSMNMLTSPVSLAAFPQLTHFHHLTAFSNQKKKNQNKKKNQMINDRKMMHPQSKNQSNLQE